ncbi:hypothetical protein N0V93_008562 [Gnomoniopsis smithogilvyi]|uniref:SH3 domain-containing protein n=1 Tax=Gnomoniopsis smithogilvyi TaxID=1191159 RepID=A0A9W8YN98_9PEZI|nr:hypothetical protein N0V93_008562 [Gnomoniopsis smithogilvyi]
MDNHVRHQFDHIRDCIVHVHLEQHVDISVIYVLDDQCHTYEEHFLQDHIVELLLYKDLIPSHYLDSEAYLDLESQETHFVKIDCGAAESDKPTKLFEARVGGGLLSAAAVAGIIALSSEQAVRQQAEAIIANASTGPPVGADAGLENAVGQATRDIWESIQDTVPGPDDPSKHWPIDLTQTSQLLAWFDNLVETTRAGARAKGKKVAPAPPVVPPNVPPGIPGLDENPGTVWRADSGVVDFNFVVRTAGYLDLKPGDRVKKIKYAGNGWLEGSKGLKRGKFPENAISPSSAATEVPKDVWSGEDGLVDGVGPQNIREWAMRDLARRRLGGMTGSAVEPGDFLRQQMKDEHNRATDYATTQKRREFYKGLINNPTNEPGNEYRRLVAWKQYIILKEVLKIIKRFDDEFKPEPPPVKPGPSPRPRPHPKPPKKYCCHRNVPRPAGKKLQHKA